MKDSKAPKIAAVLVVALLGLSALAVPVAAAAEGPEAGEDEICRDVRACFEAAVVFTRCVVFDECV